MTYTQSRDRFENIASKQGYSIVGALDNDGDDYWDRDTNNLWEGWKLALSSHPTARRDEQITRMLDQLSGGVGTFLQADGEKLSEYVWGLEAEIERLRGLFAMDDEQHAEHIKGLISRHEIRIMEYAEVIDRLRLQLEERDAEIERVKLQRDQVRESYDEMRGNLGLESEEWQS